MYCVGDSFKNKNLHTEKKKLIRVTYESMMMAINNIKLDGNLSEVGAIIQDHADKNNFSVVRDFCGHGIGSVFHEFPNVLHYKSALNNIKLVPGMVFTIEPMINIGKYNVYIEKDSWTVRTKDKSLSAQFEHTIGILEDGTAEIFTKTNIDCLKEIYCD
jgi:methionyl aminopeptidase